MDKKLYRDPQNGMIAGVCAGVAEYFGWDPTWVRLGWALFTLLGGSGLILYLIAAIIMPRLDRHVDPSAGESRSMQIVINKNSDKFGGIHYV